MKRVMTGLWLCLLVMTLGLRAQAVEYGGSIRICLDVGELPVINGAFTVYRVGSRITDGYRIYDAYGGGYVRDSDALSPHLAQWMSQMQGAEGTELLLDVDGNVVFTNLEDGLYLVKQTELTDGFYPIQPFLMTIPSQDRYAIVINAEPLPRVSQSPATGQDRGPLVGLLGMVVSAAGILLCVHGRRKIV